MTRYCLRCGVELNEWRIKDNCLMDSWCVRCGTGERWESGVLMAIAPSHSGHGMWMSIPEGALAIEERKPE